MYIQIYKYAKGTINHMLPKCLYGQISVQNPSCLYSNIECFKKMFPLVYLLYLVYCSPRRMKPVQNTETVELSGGVTKGVQGWAQPAAKVFIYNRHSPYFRSVMRPSSAIIQLPVCYCITHNLGNYVYKKNPTLPTFVVTFSGPISHNTPYNWPITAIYYLTS